jgi:hypothetical protein
MKLEDIEKMDTEFLDVQTVAEYLGKGQQNVRVSIRQGVPWAYMMGQADFRIPRRAFVSYHKYGNAVIMERSTT